MPSYPLCSIYSSEYSPSAKSPRAPRFSKPHLFKRNGCWHVTRMPPLLAVAGSQHQRDRWLLAERIARQLNEA